MGAYILNILLWLDIGLNVLLGPILNLLLGVEYQFGSRLDTLSEVFGRNRDNCKLCYGICRFFHWLDKDHCDKAIERHIFHVKNKNQ